MRYLLIFIMFSYFLSVSCTDDHLIKNRETREHIQIELKKQKELLTDRNSHVFSVIDSVEKPEEKEALEFLYAYMPLNDLLDYNSKFFHDQVKISLKAREEMSWGRSIPNDIFYHFVLPYRASNENLDTFRIAMYEELKQRVQGMNMKEAALEVNHWCHEKVTYRATDARTSSPLSLMRTSWGRCGEESVFTVDAMRTVGIPARQCFTPRWAHTDDNHAWVEVWIHGEWYFLGACEPEPELNMGWFAEPVTRAMLVNSSIYGYYNGNETVNSRNRKSTVLNVTKNYAPVKEIFIQVTDTNSNPVDSVKVFFKLFNYGELSTILLKETDKNGMVSVTSGLGDFVVWATDNHKFGYKKVTVDQADTVNISLESSPNTILPNQFDIVPPINHTPRKVDARHRDENRQRLKEEDEIRNSYMATFIDSVQTFELARKMNVDEGRFWKIVNRSAGNWKEIIRFAKTGIEFNKEEMLCLLETISDKDLRDCQASILIDHLMNSGNVKEAWKNEHFKDYVDYVLNPRIANEKLAPYRSFIQQSFTEDQKALFQADPSTLFTWTKEKIKLIENEDLSRVVISPIGVMNSRMADLFSMNVFFVATCRSLGIPARINQQTISPEYFVRGEWRSVRFKESTDVVIPKGFLHIQTEQKDFDPIYYQHWTIARYENGNYRTVGFDWNAKLSSLPEKIELNVGQYMLVTGIRKSDGTVLCNLDFFEISENETTRITAKFRNSEEQLKVLGGVNLENKVSILNTGEELSVSKLLNNHEGILLWIDPDKEPTKHVMGDLVRLKDKFEEWGGKIVLLLDQESLSESFNTNHFSGIPSNCVFVFDKKMDLIKSIEKKNHKLILPQYPIILVVDKNGKYYYYSNGYKIGIGEQLVKTLKKLSSK